MNLLIWLRHSIEITSDDNETVQATDMFDSYKDIAIVKTPIHVGRVGRIKLYGVYWSARSHSNRMIGPGEDVRILRRDGLTLTVEPLLDS